MIKKRAQAWSLDLVLASSLFAIIIVIFYLYAINHTNESQDTYQNFLFEGNNVADYILSEGYPANWNSSNVIKPGILTNDKINNTKLEQFYNLTLEDYNKTKSILRINDEFFLNLSEQIIINNAPIAGIGLIPQNEKNLIKINRFVIYNNKPISLDLYIWN